MPNQYLLICLIYIVLSDEIGNLGRQDEKIEINIWSFLILVYDIIMFPLSNKLRGDNFDPVLEIFQTFFENKSHLGKIGAVW